MENSYVDTDDFGFIEKVFMLSSEQGIMRKIVESNAFVFANSFTLWDRKYKPLDGDSVFAVMLYDEKIIAYSLGEDRITKFVELPMEWVSSIKQEDKSGTLTINFYDEDGVNEEFDKLFYDENNKADFDEMYDQAENKNCGSVVFYQCFPLGVQSSRFEKKGCELAPWLA